MTCAQEHSCHRGISQHSELKPLAPRSVSKSRSNNSNNSYYLGALHPPVSEFTVTHVISLYLHPNPVKELLQFPFTDKVRNAQLSKIQPRPESKACVVLIAASCCSPRAAKHPHGGSHRGYVQSCVSST